MGGASRAQTRRGGSDGTVAHEAALIRRVRETVDRHGMLREGRRIVVAVSGGADSVALLHALHELSGPLKLQISVAHLDHGIRGAAAAADANHVRRLAQCLGLPVELKRVNVPGLAARKGISLEMAARAARLALFARLARKHGAVIATAHHRDDQAETVLLRLLRGTGPDGLGGISPVARVGGYVTIRPLIDTSRGDIETFLRDRIIAWREDATNRDATIPRNRVRHKLLPLLERDFNPKVREALSRAAGLLRETQDWLDGEVEAGLRARLRDGALDFTGWPRLHPALRRRILLDWLRATGVPEEKLGFELAMRVDELLSSAREGAIDIARGLRLETGASDARVVRVDPRRRVRRVAATLLQIPGRTKNSTPGWAAEIVSTRGFKRAPTGVTGRLPAWTYLRRTDQPLAIRSWRFGDRIAPLGMGGSVKLQDVFTNAKLPKAERAGVPILVCGDEVVWVPGYRIARGWEVTSAGAPSLKISIRRLAGDGR